MFKQVIKRFINKPKWYNLRTVKPVSTVFALDRGTPIDRIYIEDFLRKNCNLICGSTLEIAENTYSKKFGTNIKTFEILHTIENPNVTIIGNLTDTKTLPENKIDCFICTQTLNFIYDFRGAIRGAYHLLKKNGVILATVSGISQISRYDMDRWGDYWRFTTLSTKRVFSEVFGKENVEVDFYGNVLSSIAFLEGISAEELTKEELFFKDENYQMTIVVIARKS
jgi:hypothetical protein